MDTNPYATPAADLLGGTTMMDPRYASAVADSTITQLRRTKPWARFVGIMLMILGGLIMLFGLAAFVILLFSDQPIPGDEAFQFGYRISGLLYAVVGLGYFYPGFRLNQFASRIGTLVYQPEVRNLDAALNEQRALWKFVAIIILVGVGMVAALFVVGMVIGMARMGT